MEDISNVNQLQVVLQLYMYPGAGICEKVRSPVITRKYLFLPTFPPSSTVPLENGSADDCLWWEY